MKILYQIPSLHTIYAWRTIYSWYKNAFEDLGHEFSPLTSDDNLEVMLDRINPDIFFTSLNSYYLRYIDLDVLKERKKRFPNFKVYINIPFWTSPIAKYRVNESPWLKGDSEYIDLLRSDLFDICFNSCEQGDGRMTGFEDVVGRPYYTVPLAADMTLMKHAYDQRFSSDISFIGTNLPQKRDYFKNWLLPLKKAYSLRLYWQDWTVTDRLLWVIQRWWQYFNIPILRSIQKPKLDLWDEAKIYSSSQILVNIHEDYQREYGGDCNERTFKILACWGFEICDDVACVSKYFEDGKEIVIAKNIDEWFEKIAYYMAHPEERSLIAKAWMKKVISHHTYHNRAQLFLELYTTLIYAK